MALPAKFPQANLTLKPAVGTEAFVEPLQVHHEEGCITSCWRLTPAELEEIQRTGVVWLHVFGDNSYPVCVNGVNPFGPGAMPPTA